MNKGNNVCRSGGQPGEQREWLELENNNRDGKKYSDSIYVLEAELTKLTDEYNVGRGNGRNENVLFLDSASR